MFNTGVKLHLSVLQLQVLNIVLIIISHCENYVLSQDKPFRIKRLYFDSWFHICLSVVTDFIVSGPL